MLILNDLYNESLGVTVEPTKHERECILEEDNEQQETDTKINEDNSLLEDPSTKSISQVEDKEESRLEVDEKNDGSKLFKSESITEPKSAGDLTDRTNAHEQVQTEKLSAKHSSDNESMGDTVEFPKRKRGCKSKVDNQQEKNNTQVDVENNSSGDSSSHIIKERIISNSLP